MITEAVARITRLPIGGDAELFEQIERKVEYTREKLALQQQPDGHFIYELEADSTIPSEYILMRHFLGNINEKLDKKIAKYIRSTQSEVHGGWSLFHGGDFDMSATVKAYYALKLAGDSPDEPHMKRAREAVLLHGGAAKSNVFTRYTLALFEQVPWRAAPVMPVEIMLLPEWFPFHISKVSYWSRTVIVPLTILATLKPIAVNPKKIDIQELFTKSPHQEDDYMVNPKGSILGRAFILLDKLLQKFYHRIVKDDGETRKRALNKAVEFIKTRLNDEDGLGAIFPAMANAVMAFKAMDYAEDHPDYVIAKKAVDNLVTKRDDVTYCQPCFSPIWDTGLMLHALLEANERVDSKLMKKSCEWLLDTQILDIKGDYAVKNPNLKPGGWPFQYRNDYYPDVDDTAVVVMALHRAQQGSEYAEAIERGKEWVIGMQSKNGGWGAFDIDNTAHYLNHIPFADHGALLDSPTADVSARCLSMLAQLGFSKHHPVVSDVIRFLKNEQEKDGSWFGRWGTNYVYGTWSVLCALNAIGEDMNLAYVKRAVEWLKCRQKLDGGWGEDGATYWEDRKSEYKESTPSQTAWAVLALMAAGEVESKAVKHGIEYLLECKQDKKGRFEEPWFTAVGFPRVFYLKYHGYAAYFPLMALSRYLNMKKNGKKSVEWGM